MNWKEENRVVLFNPIIEYTNIHAVNKFNILSADNTQNAFAFNNAKFNGVEIQASIWNEMISKNWTYALFSLA